MLNVYMCVNIDNACIKRLLYQRKQCGCKRERPIRSSSSVSCQLVNIGLHSQLSNEKKRYISKQTRS